MKLVQQKQKGDCGPACLATILGLTLQEVLEDFPKARIKGVPPLEMIDYLTNRGVAAMESITWPCVNSVNVPAIVTVPSLNNLGLLHYVVWNGVQYLDPSNKSLRYPDDCPQVSGVATLMWSSVILLWLPK